MKANIEKHMKAEEEFTADMEEESVELELTDDDDMELERIGMPLDDNDPILREINEGSDKKVGNGKIAIFVITKPSDRNILIFSKYILFTSF